MESLQNSIQFVRNSSFSCEVYVDLVKSEVIHGEVVTTIDMSDEQSGVITMRNQTAEVLLRNYVEKFFRLLKVNIFSVTFMKEKEKSLCLAKVKLFFHLTT